MASAFGVLDNEHGIPFMTLDMKYEFHTDLSQVDVEAFKRIPGIVVKERARSPHIAAPVNIGWKVHEMLQAAGISAVVRGAYGTLPFPQGWPSEMRAEFYGIPREKFIKNFQADAVNFAVSRDSAHIWSPPGSGKTFMAILWALCAQGPILTVTKGGARPQWVDEIRAFTYCTPKAWKPKSIRRKRDESPLDYYRRMISCGERPWLVVGWESIADLWDEISQCGFTSVIFDETHRSKSAKRDEWWTDENGRLQSRPLHNTTSCAYQLAVRTPRRLGTTGTSVVDRLKDLWGQLSLVEPHSWGKTANKFLFRYCDAQEGDYGGLNAVGMSNIDELRGRLSFSVVQIPYAVSHAELPEKRRQFSVIPVDEQLHAIEATEDRAELATLEKSIARGATLSQAMQDRVTELRILEACSRKRPAIVRRLVQHSENGRKAIAFTGRKSDVKAIYDATVKELKKEGRTDTLVLWGHGDLSVEERESVRKRYMEAQGSAILIGTFQSFGESLNLHDTDYCAVGLIPYRTGDIEQLEGRIYRLRMLRKPLIEYLVAEHSIDERIKFLVLDKLPHVLAVSEASSLSGLVDTLKNKEAHEQSIADLVADLAMWQHDPD